MKVKDPSYIVIPPKIQESTETLDIFLEAVTKAFKTYVALLNLGIKKEDARYVLPQATKSRILVKMNFKALRPFLKLRCEKTAQWEIREIAMKILQILYEHALSAFEDLYQKFILNEGEGELWTERD